VDSRELTFSGNWKWGAALGSGVEARIDGGWLEVRQGDDAARFQLGDAAPHWLEKILHPPTRLKKLGLLEGMTFRVWGELDEDFFEEAAESGCKLVERGAADLYFFGFRERQALDALRLQMDRVPPERNLWVIYPKGGKSVKEAEVMACAKEAGMGASKTLAFSTHLTGLRFARKK
jgi:hypothetical protein